MSIQRPASLGGARFTRELKAVRGFLLRDVDLTKRYLLWDVVWLIYHLINAIIIGLIAVSSGAAPAFALDHQGYVLYLCIGAVIWSYLGVVFIYVATAIAWERWEGTLEYTFMAPVHQFTRLVGMCLASVVYGLIRLIVMFCLLVWIFHLDLSGANFGGALLTLLLSTVAMLGMGLVASIFPLLSPEKGAQATEIILAMTLLLSGTYFPITVLPKLLQPLAWICPPYWALLALRQALLEHAPLREMLPNLGMLLLSGLVYMPLGYLAFRLAEAYAKRTGLLKRNG